MIVRKLRKVPNIYLDRAASEFSLAPYTLHLTAFGSEYRVFIAGEFVVYEALSNGDMPASHILGIQAWLESDNKTAKWTTYKDSEIIKPRWIHKLPRIRIE